MKRKSIGKKKPLHPEIMPADPQGKSAAKKQRQDDDDSDIIDIQVEGEEDSQADEPDDHEEGPSETEIAENAPSKQGQSLDAEESPDKDLVAVSPNDPLRRYLDEVKRYPLLDSEQEYELVSRLKNTGDIDAAKALVSANLRLVVKIAMEYRSIYSNLLDLVQEGNIGLMKAVSKFDPTKGARLGYYASWWIKSYILKYLLDNFRLVKIGTTQAQKKLFYHLMREKERLEAQGLLAGPKLLAEKLNVKEKDVIEMEQRLSGRGAEMSLDTPVDSEEGSSSHMDMLSDDRESIDEALARRQLLELLHDQLPAFTKTLNEKERRLLNDRILAEEPKTLQEVADLYGLTRERARQIEAKIVMKLRDFLKPTL